MTPVILEGLQHLYNESKKNSNKNNILKTFQLLLKSIPTWDIDIIKKEVDRINMKTKEQPWLIQLIQSIFKLNILINNLELTDLMKKETDFGLFIHTIYIECARQFWMDPFLFYHEYSSLEQKKNYCEIMKVVGQCIENAIRRLLPIRAILEKFLGEGAFNNKELELLDSYNMPLILDMEILPSYDKKPIGEGAFEEKQFGSGYNNHDNQENQIPNMQQIMHGQVQPMMENQQLIMQNQQPIMQNQQPIMQNQQPIMQNQQPIMQNQQQMMQGQVQPIMQNQQQMMQGQVQPIMQNQQPIMKNQMALHNQIGGMDTNEYNINEKILNIINKNSLLTDSNDNNNNFTVNNHSANDYYKPQMHPMMMQQPMVQQPMMQQPMMQQPMMQSQPLIQNRHHSERKTSSTLKRIIQESIRQNHNTATKSNDSHNSDIKNKILKDLDSDTANYNPEENANNYQDVFSNSEMKQTINTNEKVEKKSREKFFNNYLNI